jgi:hypothetical protein
MKHRVSMPAFSPRLLPSPAPALTPILGALLLLLALTPAFSQEGEAEEARRGDYLTLKLSVAGPGDELYFWWGHIGLVIEDAASGQNRFYDWGVFSFDADNFFVDFAFGRMLYLCGISLAESNFRAYRNANRDLTVYTLDLPAQTKEEIQRFVEWNGLPENRNYYYHLFKDNCATRIRDILDTATDGQFRAAFGEAPGRYTLRQHIRRHTWFSPFFDWFLNFLLGQDIDRPMRVWDEMFLPQEVSSRILDFSYTDAAGRERKLVRSVEVMNRAENRPQVLEASPRQWPRALALGIAAAALLGGLSLLRRRKPAICRVSLGLIQSLLGLFFGMMGLILCFMSFFTNHDYTFHNSNLIFINPLLLSAIPLGIRMARGRYDPAGRFSPEKLLRILWTYVFFGGLLTMVMKLLPMFYQQNQVTQALVLPFALALSLLPSWAGRLFRRS